ncbi:hypothetical protein BV394_03485 [Brevirhabdus pacifica]|uniref:Glycosyltransferase RgtA/B/C/D-like domain-containing protein n=1 Tax=Brevirhabdus pacifica TaxID=1267768 RepID=A0A1U7DM37_9RHOB|nr:hypothetical protein BV394_03485 [Brevirhabdus pacifica]OWU80388.1 hypothetical protein ATO5_04170 [Loktanella sp. 22II-4b]
MRRAGLWAIGAITLYRVLLLALSEAELFVDEAQYWLWGQSLEFGYYSKPPLIGWVIRAVTDLAGSDAAFWVRLPAPLLHGATALVLMAIARRFWAGWVPVLVALAYLTMPGIVVGSLLFSTDTVMLPFYALALLFYLDLSGRSSARRALAMGAALGLGAMAKYAALYFVLGAGLTALLVPMMRIAWRDAGLAALTFALVVAPNAWWNLQNGLTTVEHTLDNVDWAREVGQAPFRPNWSGLGEFVGGQFGFFGPVLFATWLVLLVPVLRRGDPLQRLLLWFSLPVVLLVCGQALASRAYANWAAAAYVAAALLVVPALMQGGRWRRWVLALSFVVNGVIAAALPLATTRADSLSLDGNRLLLARYQGRAALSIEIFDAARRADLPMIVAENRDVLADLMYRLEGQPVEVRSTPPRGRAMNHYARSYPLPEGTRGPVLYVGEAEVPPQGCPAGDPPLARIEPGKGAYRGRLFTLWRLPAECLLP